VISSRQKIEDDLNLFQLTDPQTEADNEDEVHDDNADVKCFQSADHRLGRHGHISSLTLVRSRNDLHCVELDVKHHHHRPTLYALVR